MPATAKTQTIGGQQVNTAEMTGLNYSGVYDALNNAKKVGEVNGGALSISDAGVPKTYYHKTTDSIEQVLSPGYFDAATELNDGDKILAEVAGESYELKLVGGVASVVDGQPLNRVHFARLMSRGAVKTAIYGNSITAGSFSAFTVAALKSNGAIELTQYSGVSGYTTAQVLSKMQSEGFYDGIEMCFIQEGTNDAATSVSLSTHIANLTSIINLCRSSGVLPVLILTAPTGAASSASLVQMWYYERFLAEHLDVPFFDPYRAISAPDGGYNGAYTSDVVHPLAIGYSVSGDALWSQMQNYASDMLLPRSNDNIGLWDNALMQTDTNADGLPDGWSELSMVSPTYSLVAASYPLFGNACEVAFSQSSAGYVYRDATSGFSVGDAVRISGFAGLSSSSNATTQIIMQFKGSGIERNIVGINYDCDLAYFSSEFVVPEGTTSIRILILMKQTNGGTGAGTLRIGGINLYNITDELSVVS